MTFLLDTHTVLWFLREPERLPPKVVRLIEDAGPNAAVSVASLWEIAIKLSLNKLSLPKPFEDLFPDSVTECGLSLLSIEPSHLVALTRLPFYHRDPFDRLLISQAQSERLTLLSGDSQFHACGVSLIW